MARRDIELIVALAEGRLEDETEARALIEGSDRLRTIYLSQVRALEATSDLAPVALTDTERSLLRRDLWTSLTTESSPAAPTRSGWGLQRAGYVAGAAILVVGLAAALGQLGTAGDDAGANFARGAPTEGSPSEAADDGSESPGAETDSQSAPMALAGEVEDLFGRYADMVRSGGLQYRLEGDLLSTEESKMSCLDDAGLSDHVILGDIEESGRVYLVSAADEAQIFSAGGDTKIGPETAIAFVDFATCQVVLLDE